MNRISKEEMDIYPINGETTNSGTSENFCDACDNFATEDCPYNGKVVSSTDWRNVGCTNFED